MKKRYEVVLSRPERSYSVITVEAASPHAAVRRARRIAKDDIEPDESESVGEWCDTMYGKIRLESVKEGK